MRARELSVIVCLAVVCAAAVACSDPAEDPAAPAASLPEFDADACQQAEAPTVRANAWTTGPTNNAIHIKGRHAYVVHSSNNTVGRLDLDRGEFTTDFVNVGNERNPWDLVVGESRIYITNYLSGSVTVADRDTGAVLGEVPDANLVSPSGVAIGGGKVYVASSGYEGPGYREGAVVVFTPLDEAPFLRREAVWEVAGRNTLYLAYDGAREVLYAVSGGETVFGDDGSARVGSDGTVDAYDAAGRRAPLVLPVQDDDPVAGGPGRLVTEGRYAYLPSRTAPHLYKIDLDAWEVVRGTDDPIVAYLGDGNQLTSMALAGNGRAYVTAFNQDALYVFDTECDASIAGPFSVGKGSFLEGPIDIAYDSQAGKAYTLLSLSSALSEISDAR